MSHLRDWLWGYFREQGQVPGNLSALLEMARQEEMVPLVVDVMAMQMISFLRGKGRDLTVEQQAQGMVPYIREAAWLMGSLEAAREWRPIGEEERRKPKEAREP